MNSEWKMTGGMKYVYWLTSIGKSPSVGWKWRKLKWVTCYRIDRTLYISSEEIKRFWRRAASGEFDRGTNAPGANN